MNDDQIEHIRDVARFHFQRYGGIREIAEALEVTIVGIRLPKCREFRGVALELKNGSQYIMYNTAQPRETQEHYIGHELFHLVAEHPNGWDVDREQAADVYAEELIRLVKPV